MTTRPNHIIPTDLHGFSVAEARAKRMQERKHKRIARREFGLQHGITMQILK